jgi:hypothetical protein
MNWVASSLFGIMSSPNTNKPSIVFVVTNVFGGDLEERVPTIHPVFSQLKDAQNYVAKLYFNRWRIFKNKQAPYLDLFSQVHGDQFLDLEVEDYDPSLDLETNNNRDLEMEDHHMLFIHETELMPPRAARQD